MQKVLNLKYDCRVFLCKYNRVPISFKIYEDQYYEIARGLQSVSVNLNREGMGNATVSLFIPLTDQNYPRDNTLLTYTRKVQNISRDATAKDYIYWYDLLIGEYGYTAEKASEILSKTFFEVSRDAEGNTVFIKQITSKEDATNAKKITALTTKGDKWGVLIGDKSIDVSSANIKRDNILFNKDGSSGQTLYSPILNEMMTECLFQPMDKIKIYMSNRYQKKSIDDDNIDEINESTGYSQVFDGLINQVSLSYSEGTVVVNLTAKDITRWLDISQFNVNPAIAFKAVDTLVQSLGIKPYDISFAGMSLNDIIELLVIGTTKEWIEISKDTYENAKKKYDKDQKSKEEFDKMFKVDYAHQSTVIDDKQFNYDVRNKTIDKLNNELKKQNKSIDSLLVSDISKRKTEYVNIDKSNLTLQDIDTIILTEGVNSNNVVLSDEEFNRLKKKNTNTITATAYFIKAPDMSGAGNFRLLPKGSGLAPNEYSGLSEIRLETDFSDDNLWIDPDITTFTPYLHSFNQFDLFNYSQGRRKKLEIIKEICAINEFEFFMDADGKLICKIPDYNLNPGFEIKNTNYAPSEYQNSNSLKTFKFNDDRYLIKNFEIIDYNKIISDEHVANYCIINGQFDFGVSEVALNCTDWVYNTSLALAFGLRIITKQMPLLAGASAKEARQYFASGFLNRQNAKYKSVNVTIPLRPELKLARTVSFLTPKTSNNWKISNKTFNDYVVQLWIMENTATTKSLLNDVEVGYISQINHNWMAGGLCTTKLSLTHMRFWNQTFGTLGYTRPNVLNTQEAQSRIKDRETLVKKDIETYQNYLNQLATKFNKSQLRVKPVDGILGSENDNNSTRSAIKYFCDWYNNTYNGQLSYVSLDPLQSDIRTAIQELLK